jgi:hypothetical protein
MVQHSIANAAPMPQTMNKQQWRIESDESSDDGESDGEAAVKVYRTRCLAKPLDARCLAPPCDQGEKFYNSYNFIFTPRPRNWVI